MYRVTSKSVKDVIHGNLRERICNAYMFSGSVYHIVEIAKPISDISDTSRGCRDVLRKRFQGPSQNAASWVQRGR